MRLCGCLRAFVCIDPDNNSPRYISINVLPSFSLPSFSLPAFCLPGFSLPTFSLSKFSLPAFSH